MHLLQEHGVPAAVVETPGDLVEDKHLTARGYWQRSPHPAMGPILMNGLPFRTVGETMRPMRAAPLLGEHTWELARDVLEMDRGEYERLVAAQVLF